MHITRVFVVVLTSPFMVTEGGISRISSNRIRDISKQRDRTVTVCLSV